MKVRVDELARRSSTEGAGCRTTVVHGRKGKLQLDSLGVFDFKKVRRKKEWGEKTSGTRERPRLTTTVGSLALENALENAEQTRGGFLTGANGGNQLKGEQRSDVDIELGLLIKKGKPYPTPREQIEGAGKLKTQDSRNTK